MIHYERKTYMERQKEAHGRRLFGVFPAHYPKEILWAMNILPVEIWDPHLEISEANAHLQPYVCSIVKLGLEMILQGKCKGLDGLLFPHTCDSIQNLSSMVKDYLDTGIPCFFFYHPKSPYRPSTRLYYKDLLKAFLSRLEAVYGPVGYSELERRVEQGKQLALRLTRIYEKRAAGELQSGNSEFYRVIRLGEFLHPDDFIPLLDPFLNENARRSEEGPAVVLSGILPNPEEILTLLDDLRVRVVEDDFLNCRRRIPGSLSPLEDPFEALTETYLAMPPCSTKNSSVQARADGLLEKINRSGARGVIFHMVKFCEPELFDVPQLVAIMKKMGVAALVVDTEVNQKISGQLVTRIEAFAEMIK